MDAPISQIHLRSSKGLFLIHFPTQIIHGFIFCWFIFPHIKSYENLEPLILKYSFIDRAEILHGWYETKMESKKCTRVKYCFFLSQATVHLMDVSCLYTVSSCLLLIWFLLVSCLYFCLLLITSLIVACFLAFCFSCFLLIDCYYGIFVLLVYFLLFFGSFFCFSLACLLLFDG